MRKVIAEGRNTVRGLRPSATESEYLEDVFSGIPEEVCGPQQTEFRVVVDGKPRALNAALRDEAYRKFAASLYYQRQTDGYSKPGDLSTIGVPLEARIR